MGRSTPFRDAIASARADQRLITAVKSTALRKVAQRETALSVLPAPDELRVQAGKLKRHTLDHLPFYLKQFAAAASHAGAHVHFAPDAAAARRLLVELAQRHDVRLAVKAKSMTTEEVHANAALEDAGIEVVETDLGEFVIQLDHDRPSHIVTPIIHKDRQAIGKTLTEAIGGELTDDPVELTKRARGYLREKFRQCDMGITGANFAVAETGSLCVLSNEGNARMSMTQPRVHVALVGIEKLIPRAEDLAVFLKLISRSTTGQPMGVYTSIVTGPRRRAELDGPETLHIVLLDNGRSGVWDSEFREALACIRCGACLNACPVYRNIGGHAYDSVYPGPIGSVVTPLLAGLQTHDELPYASSLCGACRQACPVDLDIPGLLVKLRAALRERKSRGKRVAMRLWREAMLSSEAYAMGQWALGQSWLRPVLARGAAGWTAVRTLPQAGKTFRQRWREGLRDAD
jgi:L-lactate dehydrogenase complex protein LldF